MMNRTVRLLLVAALLAATASQIWASTLRVVVDKTPVRSAPGATSTLQIAWADAPITADVTLNVYSLPALPSSSRDLVKLRALDAGSWFDALTWQLQRNGEEFRAIARPEKLSDSVRHRGPSAPDPVDRDATVEMTSYRAHVSVGTLPAGDYQLRVRVAGVTSDPSLFAVRNGDENPAIRDAYLTQKARRTGEYETFKQLELERVRLDPSRAGAWLALAERALIDGTLSETRDYFENAVRVMDENARKEAASATPERARALDAVVTENRRRVEKLEAVLPEYFAHRPAWTLSVENQDGRVRYVLRESATQRVVRTIE